MVFGALGSTRLLLLTSAAFVAVATGCSLDVSGEAVYVASGDASLGADSGSGHPGGGGQSDAGFPTQGDDDGDDDVSSADGGAPHLDGGPACDLGGTWADLLTIDVSWVPQGVTGVFLAAGKGQIRQWIRSQRKPSGKAFTDVDVVCGIQLPDFDGTQFAGGEHYGVRFPDALFDSGLLAPFDVNFALGGSAPGGSVTSATAAVLLGLTLASPKTDPWPSTVTTASDDDGDGDPGVTVTLAQGPGYNDLPVDLTGGRADRLDLAIRQLTSVSGTLDTCDQITGTVTIPSIMTGSTSKPAIDSHIIGCRRAADGGACTSQGSGFIDATQPVFMPSGVSTFTSVRIAAGASCAAVRKAFP